MLNDIAIPILPCRDLDETLRFYEGLGFAVAFRQTRPDVYGIIRRGPIELHFFGYTEVRPEASIAGCYLRVRNADELHAEWQARQLPASGIPRLGAIADRPWRMREFHLVDPNGNLLRVGHALPGPVAS